MATNYDVARIFLEIAEATDWTPIGIGYDMGHIRLVVRVDGVRQAGGEDDEFRAVGIETIDFGELAIIKERLAVRRVEPV